MQAATTPSIIGIGGGSASGKTTMAARLKQLLTAAGKTARVVSMDNFYLPLNGKSGDDHNWDDPSAIDIGLLIKCIIEWKQGRAAETPRHDFTTYETTICTVVPACDVMIIEGIHALSFDSLLPLYDFKLFVECDIDDAFARRVRRDTTEREYKLDLVIERYFKHVKPAFISVILPSKKNADCSIWNTSNESGNRVLEMIAKSFSRGFTGQM